MKKIKLFSFFFFFTSLINAQFIEVSKETASLINAATYSQKYNSILFFSGSSIMIYDINTKVLQDKKWYTISEDTNSISSALLWSDDEILIFNDIGYRIFNIEKASFISENIQWLGLPKDWENKIDATVRWDTDTVMFLKDDSFILYSFKEEKYVDKGNLSLWEGWPENWRSSVEATFNINGDIYFFNDGEVISFSVIEKAFSSPIKIGY